MAVYADRGYRYDGTLEGLLCCVFESYAHNEMPALIEADGSPQLSLFPMLRVETRPGLARRVSLAIHQKISPEALLLVRLAFLTCLEEREMHILRFVRLGFELGPGVMGQVADNRVDILSRAVRHLKNEQHLYKGFIRFSQVDRVLVAEIEPKNFVLPLIAGHFAGRLSGEALVIYDRTHRAALLCGGGQKEIVRLENFTAPAAGEAERHYRALWQEFYDTIAIESRRSPRRRMSRMPKRYWPMMTEFLEREGFEAPPAPAAPAWGGVGIERTKAGWADQSPDGAG